MTFSKGDQWLRTEKYLIPKFIKTKKQLWALDQNLCPLRNKPLIELEMVVQEATTPRRSSTAVMSPM